MESLKPGDVLMYRGTGVFSWFIRIKTWSDVSHTETYLGNGLSAAARNGIGVGTFETRKDGLYCALRPVVPFDFEAGLDFHNETIGQKYDWWGMLRAFYTPTGLGNNGKMWCSEHTARMAKKSGYFPFGQFFDSEKVAPFMFLASPSYHWINRDEVDLENLE